MIEKLEKILQRYNHLTELISDPQVIAKMDEWKKHTKEHSDLQDTVNKYLEYKKLKTEQDDISQMLEIESDREMKKMLEEEFYSAKDKLAQILDELKILLLPKDKNDNRNVIVEIRAGAGGDEAGLFGAELYRMYVKYAENQRWKTEDIEISQTEVGGIKEAIFSISGKNVFSRMKYESGVHRVQRVPATESQGRVHTSTVTVAILPEAEDVEVTIDEKDIKIDTYRSGGAGGQHVNKTESSIRITHLETGIVVTCQDERSQIKNREKAMKVLKVRLYDHYSTISNKEYSQNRKNLVGTGDRSERVRTYNFPQGRVTDHRINLTLYSLDEFMLGDIDQMLDALAIADREAKLLSS